MVSICAGRRLTPHLSNIYFVNFALAAPLIVFFFFFIFKLPPPRAKAMASQEDGLILAPLPAIQSYQKFLDGGQFSAKPQQVSCTPFRASLFRVYFACS